MINFKIVFNFIGVLLILNGIFMIPGIGISVYYDEPDLSALIISSFITILTGLSLYFITKKSGKEIRKREGYVVVTLGWFFISLFGALPFIIHGAIPNYTDAFFETISGYTTTGASILSDIESLPHGLLFWRSATQWFGGMGMIVLSIAILPILGIGGMQLFIAEVPGPTKDKIHPRIKETAKRLWAIYFFLTILEIILLFIGGMSLFDSVCHSFTTMATGGFSTKQASIAYYTSPFIQYVIIFFMFLAGTNFTVHYLALHGRFFTIKKNDEFKFYSFIVLGFAIFITALLLFQSYPSVEKAFRDSIFQVVSIITTTGYVTADYESWGTFFRLFFFLLLFVGGCAGSTGGGIKIVRHLLLLKNSFLELKRLIHPRAVVPVRLNSTSVPQQIISNVLAFLLFYITIFIIGSIIMSAIGLDFMSAMGAVATSLGNVGPAIGSVGPVSNFAHIPDLGKWVLSFLMLLGRLELFTVIIILSPAFWKK